MGQAVLRCCLWGWDKALTPSAVRPGPGAHPRPGRGLRRVYSCPTPDLPPPEPGSAPALLWAHPALLLAYPCPTPGLLRAGTRGRAVPSLEPAGPGLARRPAAPWRSPAPRAPVRAAGRAEAARSALKRPDELSGPCRQPVCLPPPPPRSDHSRSRHFKAPAGLGRAPTQHRAHGAAPRGWRAMGRRGLGEPGTAVGSGATHGDGPLRPGTVLPAQGKGSQPHSRCASHWLGALGGACRTPGQRVGRGTLGCGFSGQGAGRDILVPLSWGVGGCRDSQPGVALHYPNPQPGLGRNFPFPNRGWGRRASAPAPSSPSPRPSQLRKAPATFGSGKVPSKRLPGETASGARSEAGHAGSVLTTAMPLPLSCCPDGEALAPAQGGFLRATRIPGLHYMGTRPQSCLRRLLWGLAFLASAGLLATGATDRLHHLLSRPVLTRARLTRVPQLRFPAVTLCNPNRARFLQLTKPDLYSVGQWLGLSREDRSLVPELLAMLGDEQRRWLTRLANYSRFLPPRRSERTMQSFFHRLSHQIEDMLVECRFQGKRCGPQHFTPVSPCLTPACVPGTDASCKEGNGCYPACRGLFTISLLSISRSTRVTASATPSTGTGGTHE